MNCIEIAEWTADKFNYYRNSFPNKSEDAIVKFISTIRYKEKVVSKDFDELAISNLSYLDTFFKLLVLFIDIEIEKERRAELERDIYKATLHLKDSGYINKIASDDFCLINNCISHSIKYVTSKFSEKEDDADILFSLFKMLVIRQVYKNYKSYNEVETFLDMVF